MRLQALSDCWPSPPLSLSPHQGVAKAVYKALLELFRIFLQAVEDQLKREPESAIFSVFLILRLSFLLHLLPRQSSRSLRTARATTPEPQVLLPTSHPVVMGGESSQSDHSSDDGSPRVRPRAGKPVGVAKRNGLHHEPILVGGAGGKVGGVKAKAGGGQALLTVQIQRMDNGYDIALQEPNSSSRLVNGTAASNGASELRSAPTQSPVSVPDPTLSLNLVPNSRDPTPQHYSTPPSHLSAPQPVSIPPLPAEDVLRPASPSLRTPTKKTVPSPTAPLSPLLHHHPFLHSSPQHDPKTHTPLYHDLMKALGGSGRAFMAQQSFWVTLFVSVLEVDRSFLGWNEKTAELYERCVAC